MSKTVSVKIDDILKGFSATEYLSADGQYQNAVGVDPEMPTTDTGTKPSGILRPASLAVFSSTELNSHPIKIITTPKTNKIYVVLANGKLISYDNDYTNPTLLATVAGGVATGAEYLNDYIYIATTTNVSRFGLLSGTPTLTDSAWTGATLGSKTALTSNTYPAIHSTAGNYPQHPMVFHPGSNKVYFADFINGKPKLHFIQTTYDGTNDNSTYDVLDMTWGNYITCLSPFGYDLALGLTRTTDAKTNQGNSVVLFWDCTATAATRLCEIPGVLTALRNVNGTLFAIAGSVSGNGGHTLYYYAGENTFKPICSVPEGFPPLCGAIDNIGGRLVWGTNSIKDNSAVVMSFGSKDGTLPNALHCPLRSTLTASATDGVITALKYATQGTYAIPGLVVGGKNSTAFQYYLEKPSTTYGTATFRSKMFNISNDFTIKRILLGLATAVSANTTLIFTLYIDDGTKTSVLKTINSTNFPNGERSLTLYPSTTATGVNNFYLQIDWSGTALCPVLLPLEMEIELSDV